eukprot:gene10391-12290_t
MAESEAVACFIIPLLDLLDVHGLSRIILKHLRADYRALLGTTCTLCRDLVEDRYFLENLHFANCPKLTASTLTAVTSLERLVQGTVGEMCPGQATQLVSELGAVTEVLSFDLELHVGPSTPPEALEEFLSTVVMSEKSPLRAWSLDLYDNNVGDEGARSLATVLAHTSCNLRHLNLAGNNIGHEGARDLAASLESKNNTLQHLILL